MNLVMLTLFKIKMDNNSILKSGVNINLRDGLNNTVMQFIPLILTSLTFLKLSLDEIDKSDIDIIVKTLSISSVCNVSAILLGVTVLIFQFGYVEKVPNVTYKTILLHYNRMAQLSTIFFSIGSMSFCVYIVLIIEELISTNARFLAACTFFTVFAIIYTRLYLDFITIGRLKVN